MTQELSRKYDQVKSPESSKLARIFDVDSIFGSLDVFTLHDGIVVPASREGRIQWETQGENEFREFWSVVCALPQVSFILQGTES